MTKELAEYIYAIDRGEKAGDFLPYNILEERVNNELDFFKSHNVTCVVTGFCLSFFVSARILDIPVVSVLSNIFLSDWLPADKVNPLCNVVLIHGGQGTVYTAILSETPFCAVGNGNPEHTDHSPHIPFVK